MKINATQVQLIHIAKNQLGWDDDHYREVLEARYKVRTCSKLDYEQASDFIDFFISLGFKPLIKPGKKRPSGDNIVLLATPAQHEKINALAKQILWYAGADGFKMWLKKRFRLNSVKTSSEAQIVIEGLKGMLKNQDRS